MFVAKLRYEPSSSRDDAVESVLFLSRCRGSAISSDGDLVAVRMYFDSEADRDDAVSMLNRDSGIEVERIEETEVDWLELYEQSLEPIEIGGRWLIVPRRDLAPETSREVIVIPQERAFGTGSHATTALCLELIESLDLEGSSCLDVGTGSGILAIGMARSGARRIVAFDLDPEALGPIRANVSTNQAAAVVTYIGSLEALRKGTRFDCVTMNILPHVIIPLLPVIAAALVEDGVAILSGIIESETGAVLEAAAAADLQLQQGRSEGEWWAGILRNAARQRVDFSV